MRLYQRGYVVIALYLLLNVMFCFSAIAEEDSTKVGSQAQKKQTSSPATGSTTNAEEGWHLAITPYLWFPGMHGTVGALGHYASVHASAADLLSNFNFGLMGYFDIRHDRIVMPLDIFWVRLKDDKAIPFDPAVSAEAKLTETFLTQKIGARVVDAEKLKVDALVGIRYWHLGTNLSLTPSTFGRDLSGSANWVDGVAGAKIEFPLSPKAVVTIAGDAGTGGAKLDYQVAALLGYKLKKCMLQAGWRYLDVDYRTGKTAFLDVAQTGLVLGVTFNVK
jgi:hypothetical protein